MGVGVGVGTAGGGLRLATAPETMHLLLVLSREWRMQRTVSRPSMLRGLRTLRATSAASTVRDGSFVGLETPAFDSVYEFGQDHLIALERDSLGVERVVSHRLPGPAARR